MEHSSGAKAPVHLWIVGGLALLWNGFGAYDYYMTRTKGAAYIESMMPDANGTAFIDYINAFPIWASVGWALGVWGGLLGSILLLMRNKLAVPTFAVSLLGAVIGIGYQFAKPPGDPAMQGGFNAVVPLLIIAIAAALYFYARSLKAKGQLR